MADFDEIRLPDDIERGAAGGPVYNTTILELASGFEKRNQNWAQSRGSWDLSYGIQNRIGYSQVVEFFRARRGRLKGFRFKDWSDFQIEDQFLFTGDDSTTELQLFKRYGEASTGLYDRKIFKIVAGTFSITADDVDDTANVSLDFNTGVVTRAGTFLNGVEYKFTCEFDVPVRFDSDSLAVQLDWAEAGAIPSIPVVEIRQQSTV
jgi:uncharacterized protein (TIGR02217 family)